MHVNFLDSAKKQFGYYKMLGEKTFGQLTDDQLFLKLHEETNSIAIIVQHLWGNMLSRWTDFLTTDGEKQWRQRDAEFEISISDRRELLERWNEGWYCLFNTLDLLTETDLQSKIPIRKEEHSVMEAIHRQLAHYSYHVGQIVFIGKMLKGENWISLSIPKANSGNNNAEKFTGYTDEIKK